MANIAVSANAAQSEYWNAAAGETWAQFQEQLDRQLEPLGHEAMRALAPSQGESLWPAAHLSRAELSGCSLAAAPDGRVLAAISPSIKKGPTNDHEHSL